MRLNVESRTSFSGRGAAGLKFWGDSRNTVSNPSWRFCYNICMTLFEKLAAATSEEDVKAAYIKALGLKDVQRNLIDIQTKEVWFEAKLGAKHSTYAMFTQLLNYVWVVLRNALKLYAESSEGRPPDFSAFESAYKALGDKLRPKVYEYGFLRQ